MITAAKPAATHTLLAPMLFIAAIYLHVDEIVTTNRQMEMFRIVRSETRNSELL